MITIHPAHDSALVRNLALGRITCSYLASLSSSTQIPHRTSDVGVTVMYNSFVLFLFSIKGNEGSEKKKRLNSM